MIVHQLKTWPDPFRAIEQGVKCHEIRPFDRDFAGGDILLLHEYDPSAADGERYTGRVIVAQVTYVSRPGTWGLPEGLCVLSIKPLEGAITRSTVFRDDPERANRRPAYPRAHHVHVRCRVRG